MRGTEPLISQAVVAIPFRLILGDRPLLIASLLRLLTLVLTAIISMLFLREISVNSTLAVIGGILVITVPTYLIYIDRLAVLTLQWLVLSLLMAVKIFKYGLRWWYAVGLSVSLILLALGGVYTTVFVLAIFLFLLPLLFTPAWNHRLRTNIYAIVVSALAAASISFLILSHWLLNRWDMGYYWMQEFLAIKRWRNFSLPSLVDGNVLNFSLLFLMILIPCLYIARRILDRKSGSVSVPAGKRPALHRISKYTLLVFSMLVLLFAGMGYFGFTLPLMDICLWGLLLSWAILLASWNDPWSDEKRRVRYLSGVLFYVAFIFLLLALGSPIAWNRNGAELGKGIFGFVAWVIPPLSQLRELSRFMVPAAWSFAIGLILALDAVIRSYSKKVILAIAAAFALLIPADRLGKEFKFYQYSDMPQHYELLKNSSGPGALLELPFPQWNSWRGIMAMGWQHEHGRPIVTGYTGVSPAWYQYARLVFMRFPSRGSLWLMKKWNVDTVLLPDQDDEVDQRLQQYSEALIPRGKSEGYRLFDLSFDMIDDELGGEVSAGELLWKVPELDGFPESRHLIGDGIATPGSSLRITGDDRLTFGIDDSLTLRAVEIDYGYGIGTHVPAAVKVLGLIDGEWKTLNVKHSGRYLHARAADLLMRSQFARIRINLKRNRATRFRIVASDKTFLLPELAIGLLKKHSS